MAYAEFRKDRGVECQAAEIAEWHATWGHEVHFHCIAHPGNAPSAIVFHQVPTLDVVQTTSLFTFALSARVQLQRGAYDITHTHGTVRGSDVITAHGCHRAALRALGGHGGLGTADWVRLQIERKNFIGRNYRRVIAVSRMTRRELIAEYGVPEGDIVVIPPGIAPRASIADGTYRKTARERFNIRSEQIAILFVGHEFRRKGLDVLISALSICDNQRLVLLVCGDDMHLKYQALARDLGIGNRVHFLGYQQDVNMCYEAADIFALPTKHDAFGLVVLEAMAHGLPVIVSRMAGAVEEAITDGTDGMVLENPASAGELAELLNALIGNEPLRRSMGDAARVRARTFTWETCARRALELYKVVLEEKMRNATGAGA